MTPTKTPALLPTREELKGCPFCGGTTPCVRRNRSMSWVSCPSCGLETPTETGVTDEQAVAYWNTRHSPAPAKGENPLWKTLLGVHADRVRGTETIIRLREAAGKVIASANNEDLNPLEAIVHRPYLEALRSALTSPATPAGDSDELRVALRLAHPIVEADLHAAIGQCDADWEGMFRMALEAFNSALSTATPPEAVDGGEG